MNYRQYEAEDFAMDTAFQAWVQNGMDDAFWTGWLAEHPDRAAALEAGRELVLSLAFQPAEPTPADMEAVMLNIGQSIEADRRRRLAVRRRWLMTLSGAAAAVLMAVVFWKPASSIKTVSTSFGETKTVTLPDGSTVLLGGHSSLSWPERWSTSREREVTLQGEGFFHVTKKPAGMHPKFRVRTPYADVEVVGTAFRMYHRRDSMAVELEEGKVRVKGEQLAPGEMAAFTSTAAYRGMADMQRLRAWKEGRLQFEDAPLQTIAHTLEDNYGYTVIFRRDELRMKKLTGSCPTGAPDILLDAIRTVHGIKTTIQNRQIIFE
ncbi:FecR family protein [Chitinophaga lutea]